MFACIEAKIIELHTIASHADCFVLMYVSAKSDPSRNDAIIVWNRPRKRSSSKIGAMMTVVITMMICRGSWA